MPPKRVALGPDSVAIINCATGTHTSLAMSASDSDDELPLAARKIKQDGNGEDKPDATPEPAAASTAALKKAVRLYHSMLPVVDGYGACID